MLRCQTTGIRWQRLGGNPGGAPFLSASARHATEGVRSDALKLVPAKPRIQVGRRRAALINAAVLIAQNKPNEKRLIFYRQRWARMQQKSYSARLGDTETVKSSGTPTRYIVGIYRYIPCIFHVYVRRRYMYGIYHVYTMDIEIPISCVYA